MKNILVILTFSLLLMITGCSEAEPAANPSQLESPDLERFEEALDEPVSLGEKAQTGITDFTIYEVIRPGNEIVLEATYDTLEPAVGMEYVAVRLLRACTAQDCYVRLNDMRMISSAGKVYRPQLLEGDDFLHDLHVHQGSIPVGYVVFLVDQNEDDLVFCYESDIEDAVCMATE